MSAHIYLRRGCIVFVGELPDLPPHEHIAAAICAGPDGPIEIRGRGLPEWHACRTAYIPSGARHEVRMNGRRFATVMAEPGQVTWDPPSLSDEDRGEDDDDDAAIVPEPLDGPAILSGFHLLEQARTPEDVRAGLDRILPMQEKAMDDLDPRILRVQEILLAAPDEAPGVDELSRTIGMSRSWLLHAFKAQVGVPIRRYRTWFRLKAAVLLMKHGETLAQAALGAGFYDQSHFANAFREIIGIQPGLVFREPGGIRWYIDDESLTERLLAENLR